MPLLGYTDILNIHPAVLIILIAWTMVWKGLALWKAARKKNSPVWFVILLVVNTIGILEILYLFLFSEMGKEKSKSQTLKKKRR